MWLFDVYLMEQGLSNEAILKCPVILTKGNVMPISS